MLLTSQSLSQAVRRHHFSWHILNPHRVVSNLLPDEVVPNRDVLRPAMTNGVVGQRLSALIICANSRWRICSIVVFELLEEGAHPFYLLGDFCKSHIFC